MSGVSRPGLAGLFDRIERRYGPGVLIIEADLLRLEDPYRQELPPGVVAADGGEFHCIEPLACATDADHFVLLAGPVATG